MTNDAVSSQLNAAKISNHIQNNCPKKEVVWLNPTTPKHLNPAINSQIAVAIVGSQIFASPLRYKDNWKPLPYLAESWELSTDGLSLTLHLVKGATFHDGYPITSAQQAVRIVSDDPFFGVLFFRASILSFNEFKKVLTEFLDYQHDRILQTEKLADQKIFVITRLIISEFEDEKILKMIAFFLDTKTH